jgi:transposase-like protein
MRDQKTPTSFPKLTCSLCGESALFRLPGVTERTRYTCPRCCARILVERGDLEPVADSTELEQDPELRQIARDCQLYADSQASFDDLSSS